MTEHNTTPQAAAHRRLIESFYAAFQRLDTDAMAACYAPEATFDDEAFSLRGKDEVMGMWRMLAEGARAHSQGVWALEVSEVAADEYGGQAHWEAHYIFSATGRKVHNKIDARFGFDASGLIAVHRDRFDFPAWSRQALGLPGVLLGWSPWLRKKVRAQAAHNLRRFMQKGGA